MPSSILGQGMELIRGPQPIQHSDQAFEEALELADLAFDVERAIERVEDRDGQGAVVAVAFEEVDDPAVLDLPLADLDLELAGLLPVSRRRTFWTKGKTSS